MAKYTFNKDYSQSYDYRGAKASKTFKKGDVIEGEYLKEIKCPPNAYCIMADSPPRIMTTLDGKLSKGNGYDGEVILMIPIDFVDGDKGSSNTATNKNLGKDQSNLAKNIFGDNSDMFATGSMKATLFGVVVGTIIGFAYKHPIKGALIGLGAGIVTYPILSKIPKN